jgi:ATP-dependent Clp protease ATP-binding subunit ClpB
MDDLKQIVEIQLERVRSRLADQGFGLDLSEAAKSYLAEKGYEPVYGARPLKRTLQRELQDPLALRILAGDFKPGETIHVEHGTDGLEFEAVKPKEAAQPVL